MKTIQFNTLVQILFIGIAVSLMSISLIDLTNDRIAPLFLIIIPLSIGVGCNVHLKIRGTLNDFKFKELFLAMGAMIGSALAAYLFVGTLGVFGLLLAPFAFLAMYFYSVKGIYKLSSVAIGTMINYFAWIVFLFLLYPRRGEFHIPYQLLYFFLFLVFSIGFPLTIRKKNRRERRRRETL